MSRGDPADRAFGLGAVIITYSIGKLISMVFAVDITL